MYYIIGQSNVFYSMGELVLDLGLAGRRSELCVDYDNNRNMRFYRISSTDYEGLEGSFAQGTQTLFTDVYSGAHRMMPKEIEEQVSRYAGFTPSSASYDRNSVSKEVFYALGYMFAYNMTERSNVPVGVIEIDASGHPLITFAPNELADKWGNDVCGPVLTHVEYVGSSKAYLEFDYIGKALNTADDSGYVTGLEILIGINGSSQWIEHEGFIITDSNVITVDAGSFELYGVRYGRSTDSNHPHERNLCNSYKMPAIAFVDYNVKEYFELSIDNNGWDIHTPEKTTGYDYRYGPTIITNEDGSMDAWFSCTGSNESEELDYFTYKHSDDGGKTWSKEKIVLSPTGLSKDRLSVCDPGAIYFNGYYLGYTSTLDKAGYSNHVFVARSKMPDGPYEKWNGSSWGASPAPLLTYEGHGEQWGMGEVSFVKVEDTIYIYYSLKCETGQYTLFSTADANDENWPATVQYQGVALKWGNAQAAA